MELTYCTRARLDRLTASAKELSEATGNQCLPVQADVRDPKQVQDAVAKAVEKFGRIDFVICGMWQLRCDAPAVRSLTGRIMRVFAGAAGNFLAPISKLSENGFRTVIEIDTVCLISPHGSQGIGH